MSKEQHSESKLSNNKRHKLHLHISKILDKMQTRMTSFRNRNDIDSLGFGFRIDLWFSLGFGWNRFVKGAHGYGGATVNLIGEVVWRRGCGWRSRSLGAKLIYGSRLIRWLWMWRLFFFFTLSVVVYGCSGSSWWLVAAVVGGCGGCGMSGWMWWSAMLGWERERQRERKNKNWIKNDKERIFKWTVKKIEVDVRNIVKWCVYVIKLVF